jgi:hypothetical protein
MTKSKLLDNPLVQRFHELVPEWKTSTAVSSSLSEMFEQTSYREIIALGERAVPLLLAELEREPDWWFAALKTITGADPVAPDSRGKLLEMTRSWLDWGRAQGYRW